MGQVTEVTRFRACGFDLRQVTARRTEIAITATSTINSIGGKPFI